MTEYRKETKCKDYTWIMGMLWFEFQASELVRVLSVVPSV